MRGDSINASPQMEYVLILATVLYTLQHTEVVVDVSGGRDTVISVAASTFRGCIF